MDRSNNDRLKNPIKIALLLVQTAILGLLILIYLDEPTPDDRRPSVITDTSAGSRLPSRPSPTSVTIDDESLARLVTELGDEWRAILREELTEFRVGPTPGDDGGSPPVVSETQPTSTIDPREREYALEASESIVWGAITSGTWTRRDTEALLPHLNLLTPQQRLEMADQLYSAINRQELEMEDFPPL